MVLRHLAHAAHRRVAGAKAGVSAVLDCNIGNTDISKQANGRPTNRKKQTNGRSTNRGNKPTEGQQTEETSQW